MNNKSKLSLLLGSIVILATVLIFVIRGLWFFPASIIGFAFLIYAEIVFFGGIILIDCLANKSSKLFTIAGVGTTIEGYAILVFIVSFIYMHMHLFLFRGFLIIQIILAVIAAIISFALFAFSQTSDVKEKKILNANMMCNNFESELLLIKERVNDKESIDKLIEGIKYSDTSSMCDADVEIDVMIKELNNIVNLVEFDEEKYKKIIKEIEFLIKKRNLQIKSEKQGGF